MALWSRLRRREFCDLRRDGLRPGEKCATERNNRENGVVVFRRSPETYATRIKRFSAWLRQQICVVTEMSRLFGTAVKAGRARIGGGGEGWQIRGRTRRACDRRRGITTGTPGLLPRMRGGPGWVGWAHRRNGSACIGGVWANVGAGGAGLALV